MVALTLVVLLASACTAEAASTADRPGADVTFVREATLVRGTDVELVADPVLVITGPAVDNPNVGQDLLLDRAALEGLAQWELRTFEPFLNQDLSFTGVWMSDLLELAGAADAQVIDTHALDDYRITFDADDMTDGGAFLAIRQDGEYIGVADAGPTRIVFPDGSPTGAVDDNWIWSLDVITVE